MKPLDYERKSMFGPTAFEKGLPNRYLKKLGSENREKGGFGLKRSVIEALKHIFEEAVPRRAERGRKVFFRHKWEMDPRHRMDMTREQLGAKLAAYYERQKRKKTLHSAKEVENGDPQPP